MSVVNIRNQHIYMAQLALARVLMFDAQDQEVLQSITKLFHESPRLVWVLNSGGWGEGNHIHKSQPNLQRMNDIYGRCVHRGP